MLVVYILHKCCRRHSYTQDLYILILFMLHFIVFRFSSDRTQLCCTVGSYLQIRYNIHLHYFYLSLRQMYKEVYMRLRLYSECNAFDVSQNTYQ